MRKKASLSGFKYFKGIDWHKFDQSVPLAFFRAKIWIIRILFVYLPVVTTNHVMRWRSIVDEKEEPK